jgi:hypothetical protein
MDVWNRNDDVDLDTDGDGFDDRTERYIGLDPDAADSNGDGENDWDQYGEGFDAFRGYDTDLDRILDTDEPPGDADENGVPNIEDDDDDGDSIPTRQEVALGTDPYEADSDGDGISDFAETAGGERRIDFDGDGVIDARDKDSDNDGISDRKEQTDAPDAANHRFKDADRDHIPDHVEQRPISRGGGELVDGTPEWYNPDRDADENYLDTDSDNDGRSDFHEGYEDPDGDLWPNFVDRDSDNDGVSDRQDTDPYAPHVAQERCLLEGAWAATAPPGESVGQVDRESAGSLGEALDWFERSGGIQVPGGLFATERVDLRLLSDDGATELDRGFVVTKDGRVVSAARGEGTDPTLRVYVTQGAATRLGASTDPVATLQAELDAGTVRYEGVGLGSSVKVAFAKFVYAVWKFIRGAAFVSPEPW